MSSRKLVSRPTAAATPSISNENACPLKLGFKVEENNIVFKIERI
jgi:hypothetical protein